MEEAFHSLGESPEVYLTDVDNGFRSQWLEYLTSRGILREETMEVVGGHVYSITPKGYELLKVMFDLVELLR